MFLYAKRMGGAPLSDHIKQRTLELIGTEIYPVHCTFAVAYKTKIKLIIVIHIGHNLNCVPYFKNKLNCQTLVNVGFRVALIPTGPTFHYFAMLRVCAKQL